MALDYGEKRTGIAVTDEMQLIASGLTTVKTDHLFDFLADYFEKEPVARLVIGEPKQKDGSPSSIEKLIQPVLKKLKERFPNLSIERQDERFTSKMAVQSLIDGGLKKKKRQNRALIDEVSATIILQSYLERK